jgi:hypothetical protein
MLALGHFLLLGRGPGTMRPACDAVWAMWLSMLPSVGLMMMGHCPGSANIENANTQRGVGTV